MPTWSPDGRYLLFGDLLGRRPKAEMSIHLLDLTTRKLQDLPESKGLWSPRWSPDGQFIVAITSDSKAIRVRRWPATEWIELARMDFVDNASWSADSRYVYFNGRDEAFRAWLFRLGVPEGTLERLVKLDGFPGSPENWYGVSPDGSPLGFRGVFTDEVFALKCALP